MSRFVAAFSLVLLSLGFGPRDPEAEVINVNDKAPKFSIKLVDGSELDLTAARGKVVVLNFFATWCVPCLKELPELQEIWNAHKGRPDFAMIAVGRDETDESVNRYREKHGFQLPMAADTKKAVYLKYAEKYVPRTFIISRDGIVRFSSKGIDETTLAKIKNELATQFDKAK